MSIDPSIDIRPATAADLDQAVAIWHSGWADGHAAIVPPELTRLRTLESFRERLNRDLPLTRVAVRGGKVLGFHILKADELYQFYVAAGARGTGLAARLMDDAEDTLRAAGHARAWLACSVGNTRAARFYEKSGWHRAATQALAVETSDGPFTLDVWRYEKAL